MPSRRREVEISVERPLGPPGSGAGSVRLTTRLEAEEDGSGPTPAELQRELEALTERLNAIALPPLAALPAARAERSLAELVDTYRPRQRELIDLLREEGELTPAEHAQLVDYLASAPERRAPPAPVETARLIATVPIDRPTRGFPREETGSVPAAGPGAVARTVPELLRTYQISSLRQAGAVRARRQISFAEYMALKRYFEAGGVPASAEPGPGGTA